MDSDTLSGTTTATRLIETGPGFGGHSVDEALVFEHDGTSWGAPQTCSLEQTRISSVHRALHYGQSVFEGMKAVRGADGRVALFRALDHLHRLERSCRRMGLAEPDARSLHDALLSFVGRHTDHAPDSPGFLYVRPIVHAADEDLLPSVASRARLQITLHPVVPFLGAKKMIRVRTPDSEVRAFPGGTGAVKCAGNYASVMVARRRAAEEGFDEVLWLDALERRWVEETSSANVMVVRNGVLVTPPTGDTVLSGITRDTLMMLARRAGIGVVEDRVPIDPGYWANVDEAFCCGTAVGVVAIGDVVHGARSLHARTCPGPVTARLAEEYAATLDAPTRGLPRWRELLLDG